MKLHKYQEKAIEFWLKNTRAYLAIDMGLGKTAITLHALTKIKQPALIIAPLSVIHNTWPEEIRIWNLPLTYTLLHGKDKNENLKKKVDIYLTNFESVEWLYDQLYDIAMKRLPMPFEIVIIDEASKIKDSQTKRFKLLDAMRPLFPKYRLLLSGTPAPQSYLNLWSQYHWLTDGKTFDKQNFYAFRNKYYSTKPFNPYVWNIKKDSEKTIFKKIKPVTFRLDAKDYLKLPPITYNYIKITLTAKLMKQYKQLKDEFLLELDDIDHSALNSATLSSKLRQFIQGFLYYDTDEIKPNGKPVRKAAHVHDLKLSALKSLVEDTGQPILVVIQFKHELEMIRNAYPGTPVIAGQTNIKDANTYIKRWNRRELPLLLCHPASISHGVNLQAGGNNVTWYSLSWSLEQYLQLNGRLHRQGQKKGVVVHHLSVDNTIDIKIAKVLSERGLNQQKLLDFLRDESNY